MFPSLVIMNRFVLEVPIHLPVIFHNCRVSIATIPYGQGINGKIFRLAGSGQPSDGTVPVLAGFA
jgi:hypothetical protein